MRDLVTVWEHHLERVVLPEFKVRAALGEFDYIPKEIPRSHKPPSEVLSKHFYAMEFIKLARSGFYATIAMRLTNHYYGEWQVARDADVPFSRWIANTIDAYVEFKRPYINQQLED